MPTTYTIHLKNLQSVKNKFWCFLASPEKQVSKEVFANSDTYLTVSQHRTGLDNSFTIPMQYIVQAGASNKAVRLNTQIQSHISKDVNLGEEWLAEFFLDNEGPELKKNKDGVVGNKEVHVVTNPFDKEREPINRWFNNITFGVKSESGFMGFTWSPAPKQEYLIVPKVRFYVATGDFESNKLVNMSSVSLAAAEINVSDFDGNNECTVTLNKDGTWTIEPGNKNQGEDSLVNLVKLLPTSAISQIKLVELCSNMHLTLNNGTVKNDEDEYVTSEGLEVNTLTSDIRNNECENFILAGTITVATLITASVVYMIAGGITIKVSKKSGSEREYEFTYDGSKGVEALKAAFAAGKTILLRKK
ncbi:hypothetical protein [Atlantibacter subterraneus]|uniref:hypothetical protein n=1 Tax=Atlantibacter subterraneus TaxID=255519 RepID=UPI00289EBCC9|nr:hypothetical protein [Atlantibacter subterranea]